MNPRHSLIIDGREVAFDQERNVLEVARKAGIDIPTFCYHSHLSVYGACRLCLVDIEGRGVVTSCSTLPEAGMQIRTNSQEIRSMRKIAVELLLANHEQSCPTCPKSAHCQLQSLARRLGVNQVRFKNLHHPKALDLSSEALVRDPNKCILCGDCVRMCNEVQGIGALDFAHRGHQVQVVPAFGKNLRDVDCVNCGQCAAVCPTAAITPRSQVDAVWQSLDDPKKVVVAQIAPAVRVAIGEAFNLPPGTMNMGQIVAALKQIGFAKVFDTAFAADLTVIEEATEFMARLDKQERLPQFTSCCPAWVTYAERHHPAILNQLSTCRSPQQMFGAVARTILPKQLGIDRADLVVVSIMPCTAKKVEAGLEKFRDQGQADVDFVLTTQELAHMIEQAGLRFTELVPASLDLPLGFKTGAGVIFGASGGVSEAVLRYAGEKLCGHRQGTLEFNAVRGASGIKEAEIRFGERTLRLAIAHGLANAKTLLAQLERGEVQADLVEIMACPGGCVGGAGQPVTHCPEDIQRRTRALYDADRTLQLHKSQENHIVAELYRDEIGPCGGEGAHQLLHTHYHHRKRIDNEVISLGQGNDNALDLRVCVGTNCHLRGAQDLLHRLIRHVHDHDLDARVDVQATFCFEQCDRGPSVRIADQVIHHCTFEAATATLDRKLSQTPQAAPEPATHRCEHCSP